MIIISSEEQRPYVLKREREIQIEQRSTFYLKAIKTSVVARIQDTQATMDQGGTFGFKTAQATLEILREGLAGWENVRDAKGNDVPFRTQGTTGRPSQATIDSIPIDAARELAAEIEAGGRLEEDEEKN